VFVRALTLLWLCVAGAAAVAFSEAAGTVERTLAGRTADAENFATDGTQSDGCAWYHRP